MDRRIVYSLTWPDGSKVSATLVGEANNRGNLIDVVGARERIARAFEHGSATGIDAELRYIALEQRARLERAHA